MISGQIDSIKDDHDNQTRLLRRFFRTPHGTTPKTTEYGHDHIIDTQRHFCHTRSTEKRVLIIRPEDCQRRTGPVQTGRNLCPTSSRDGQVSGKFLLKSVEGYNKAIASFERRLLPAVRRFHDMGVATSELVAPEAIDTQPSLPSAMQDDESMTDGD